VTDSDETAMFTREFWDERYATSARIWSGNPNPRLVEHVSALAPGTAIDVGCGEGADAVWLAAHGWQVTGVDVSSVALERARQHAAEAGVADRISWQQVDLVAGEPLPDQADLVSVQFLHLPASVFGAVYAALADAVRPGGKLLVVGHHPDDAATGLRNERLTHLLFAPHQVAELLDDAEWQVQVSDAPTREVDREGRQVTVTDTVVLATRRPAVTFPAADR
jgi:SAM-dependent methyltransferase